MFLPLRGTNFKTTRETDSHFFKLDTLKSTAKSSRCAAFEAEHLKRYQTRFCNPKRYECSSGPPHAVRAYIVSRDTASNSSIQQWSVFTDDLTMSTISFCYETLPPGKVTMTTSENTVWTVTG